MRVLPWFSALQVMDLYCTLHSPATERGADVCRAVWHRTSFAVPHQSILCCQALEQRRKFR